MSTFVPSDADGAGPGRAVLPRRVRAGARLRPRRRAQLRARAVPVRRRVRHLVGGGSPARGRAARLGLRPRRGLRGGVRDGVAALVELVLIRPLYPAPIEQVLVTVGLSLAGVALLQASWGADPRPYPRPQWTQRAHQGRRRRACRTTGSCSSGPPSSCCVGLLAFLQVHPDRPGHPGRRRGPLDGHRARHRRAPGVHARLRHRRRRGRPGRGARRGLHRRDLADRRQLAAHLRLHRRGHRRHGLGRRRRLRRGRRRAAAAVRQLHLAGPRRHLRGRPAGGRAAGPPAGITGKVATS